MSGSLGAKKLILFLGIRVSKLHSIIGWITLAAWIETEGNISSYICRSRVRKDGTRSPCVSRRICIMQKDRFPLEILVAFLETQGIPSSVSPTNPTPTAFSRTPYFRLNITGLNNLDEVITKCTPFFITKKARFQVERYWRYRHSTADELRRELAKRYGNREEGGTPHSP